MWYEDAPGGEWRWVAWAMVIAVAAFGAHYFVLPIAIEGKGRWARLSQAITTGDSKAATALLQQEPGLLDGPDRVSYLLMLAIRSRDDAVVEMLLKDSRVRARVNTAGSVGAIATEGSVAVRFCDDGVRTDRSRGGHQVPLACGRTCGTPEPVSAPR